MSEPHLHTDEGHAFLESYYQQAILAARDFLDPSVPIVLFEWTYEMSKWDENAFPEAMYGKVAHLKMKGQGAVVLPKQLYDLMQSAMAIALFSSWGLLGHPPLSLSNIWADMDLSKQWPGASKDSCLFLPCLLQDCLLIHVTLTEKGPNTTSQLKDGFSFSMASF